MRRLIPSHVVLNGRVGALVDAAIHVTEPPGAQWKTKTKVERATSALLSMWVSDTATAAIMLRRSTLLIDPEDPSAST